MSLPDNGSITAAQLMDTLVKRIFVAGISTLAFQSESEPNHAIFVSCATRLAAMRHTNWTARRAPFIRPKVIKITS
jgi:hypothetical protein